MRSNPSSPITASLFPSPRRAGRLLDICKDDAGYMYLCKKRKDVLFVLQNAAAVRS